MTNIIKITLKEPVSYFQQVSFFAGQQTLLYLNCHINLMEYSTPVILHSRAMILACMEYLSISSSIHYKNELSLSWQASKTSSC